MEEKAQVKSSEKFNSKLSWPPLKMKRGNKFDTRLVISSGTIFFLLFLLPWFHLFLLLLYFSYGLQFIMLLNILLYLRNSVLNTRIVFNEYIEVKKRKSVKRKLFSLIKSMLMWCIKQTCDAWTLFLFIAKPINICVCTRLCSLWCLQC